MGVLYNIPLRSLGGVIGARATSCIGDEKALSAETWSILVRFKLKENPRSRYLFTLLSILSLAAIFSIPFETRIPSLLL